MALSLHQDLTRFELQNHFAFVAEIVRWLTHDQKVHSSNIGARKQILEYIFKKMVGY